MTNEFVMTVGPNPSSGAQRSGAAIGVSSAHGHCMFSSCTHFFSHHFVPILILVGVAGATIRCVRLSLNASGSPAAPSNSSTSTAAPNSS
ncbi:unnamed protein product [Bursaphelenchus okinawaensis]|uniref:Uncharacterized protein n=1 Tax=Bursaphelenchus okinawaensis TaxID=465554 RepID=A0A811L9L7_9BILA|nr:unnamed protein product [Bursaphelenchus okinawaensis]CAG9118987.1 unnamed protein product [Bursaphelenchus okinawaensis]